MSSEDSQVHADEAAVIGGVGAAAVVLGWLSYRNGGHPGAPPRKEQRFSLIPRLYPSNSGLKLRIGF